MTCPGAVSVSHRQAGCLGSCSKSKAEQSLPAAGRAAPAGGTALWGSAALHLAAGGHSFAGLGASPPSLPCIAP